MLGQFGVKKRKHRDAVLLQYTAHLGEVLEADIFRQMREYRERRAHRRRARVAGNAGSGDKFKTPIRALRRLSGELKKLRNHVQADISKVGAVSQADREPARPATDVDDQSVIPQAFRNEKVALDFPDPVELAADRRLERLRARRFEQPLKENDATIIRAVPPK